MAGLLAGVCVFTCANPKFEEVDAGGQSTDADADTDTDTDSDVDSGPDLDTDTDTDSDTDTDTGPSLCNGVDKYLFNFENGPDDFVGAAPWEHGTAESGCHDGSAGCFATVLNGNYESCQSASLERAIDLSACADASNSGRTIQISFWHYYQFEPGAVVGVETKFRDGGRIQVSRDGGSTWSDTILPDSGNPYQGRIETNKCSGALPEINGRQGWSGTIVGGEWRQVTAIVQGTSQRTEQFMFRFLFGSNAEANYDGWVIDDVAVEAK